MTSKIIAQTDRQQKSEKPQGSGILQRAAVRSVPVTSVQPTEDAQSQALRNSPIHKDFSRVPISMTKTPLIMAKQIVDTDNSKSDRVHQENKTGLPDNLKANIENLSGMSMDDVKVHYNSSKPAQLQALAYTQGIDIHVAPGQERHLPHETWHVVQQKRGLVKATKQAKGVAINDDMKWEREAEEMGGKATSMRKQAKDREKARIETPDQRNMLQYEALVQRVEQRIALDAENITNSMNTKRSRGLVGEEGIGNLLVGNRQFITEDNATLLGEVIREVRRVGTEVRNITNNWKDMGSEYKPMVYRVTAKNKSSSNIFDFYIQFSKQFTGYITEITRVGENGRQEVKMVKLPIELCDGLDLVSLFSDIYTSGHESHGEEIINEIEEGMSKESGVPPQTGDAMTKVVGEGSRFVCVEEAYRQGLLGDNLLFYTRLERVEEANKSAEKKDRYVGISLSKLWLKWNAFGKDYGISDARVARFVKIGMGTNEVPETMMNSSTNQKKTWLHKNLKKELEKIEKGESSHVQLHTLVEGDKLKGYNLDTHTVVR